MKIKINGHKNWIPWERVREIFVLFLFYAILATAAFGWGRIYEYSRHEDLRKEVYIHDQKIKEINGRLIAVEGKKR